VVGDLSARVESPDVSPFCTRSRVEALVQFCAAPGHAASYNVVPVSNGPGLAWAGGAQRTRRAIADTSRSASSAVLNQTPAALSRRRRRPSI
jgi:hypothetical protein